MTERIWKVKGYIATNCRCNASGVDCSRCIRAIKDADKTAILVNVLLFGVTFLILLFCNVSKCNANWAGL